MRKEILFVQIRNSETGELKQFFINGKIIDLYKLLDISQIVRMDEIAPRQFLVIDDSHNQYLVSIYQVNPRIDNKLKA